MVLFGVSAALRSRGVGSAKKRARKSELPRQRSSSKAEGLGGAARAEDTNKADDSADNADNMDDIEAILRRHGIS